MWVRTKVIGHMGNNMEADRSGNDTDREGKLRTVRTRRDKVLRFDGEDEDGCKITWYVAYRGNFGWSACRETGEWMDDPDEKEVRSSFDVYDHADVVDISETPEEVTI